MKKFIALLSLLIFFAGVTLADPVERDKPWELTEGVVYGQSKGRDMIIDIFTPTGRGHRSYLKPGDGGVGLGLIDIISGGWNDSDPRRGEHEVAGLFDIFCSRGYTVFAVRPGGLPHYNALEMVENVHRAIRWVKDNAKEYGVDPERLGLVGASAGGHLSLLTMATAQPASPDSDDPLLAYDTGVKAVGVFFPPTDFLNWDGAPINYERRPHLLFSDGLEGKTKEEQDARAMLISPVRQINGPTPPVFVVHGDADPIVPLQQTEVLVDKLRELGTDVTLHIKDGGGHFWLTIYREIILAADWFDQKLRE